MTFQEKIKQFLTKHNYPFEASEAGDIYVTLGFVSFLFRGGKHPRSRGACVVCYTNTKEGRRLALSLMPAVLFFAEKMKRAEKMKKNAHKRYRGHVHYDVYLKYIQGIREQMWRKQGYVR